MNTIGIFLMVAIGLVGGYFFYQAYENYEQEKHASDNRAMLMQLHGNRSH